MHGLDRFLKSRDEQVLPQFETDKLLVVVVEAAAFRLENGLTAGFKSVEQTGQVGKILHS